MSSVLRLFYTLRESIARAVIKIALPELGAQQQREFAANTFQDRSMMKEEPHHVLVENQGAPVTIFSFSSSALLYAGQPTFEFQGFLKQKDQACNLVFFRDIYRTSYHLAPGRQPNGLQFFENQVRSLMKQLGADYHIAIGDSSGGSAALYFGTHCGMDKVIAFNPSFPLSARVAPMAQLGTYLDLKLLAVNPGAYREVAALTFISLFVLLKLLMVVGRKGIWDPIRTYREAPKRPPATVFFGEQCRPDAKIAHLLDGIPEVKLVPLPTARHSSGIFLAKRGELRTAIMREIAEGGR